MSTMQTTPLGVATISWCIWRLSAGAIFQQVDDVPPLLRASWRLQLTSLVLALSLIQWYSHGHKIKHRFFEKHTLMWLFAGGLFLALHFGAWVASLDETSLTHSLLFVTAHPLIIVFGMFLIARLVINFQEPSNLEIIGACVGFTGAALALLDLEDQQGDRTLPL